MTLDLIAWLTAPEDIRERRARIAGYLVNEGYELPPLPRNAGYDEAGASHLVRGQEMTVAYSVVDQGGRRVYHYVEWEVDHIMLGRIHFGDEWALGVGTRVPRLYTIDPPVRESDMEGARQDYLPQPTSLPDSRWRGYSVAGSDSTCPKRTMVRSDILLSDEKVKS